MYCYAISPVLTALDQPPAADVPGVILLTSEELSRQSALPGLETVLHHAPAARDARLCKAEARSDCLCGTLVLPRRGHVGTRPAFGFLIADKRVVLVDDGAILHGQLKRLAREKRWYGAGIGRFFYDLLQLLIARDLQHLEQIEDRVEQLEDRVLSGQLEGFSADMTGLRKEAMAAFRYYSQLDDAACVLRENENGFFTEGEQTLLRLFEERIVRLREESQLLREYCLQVQTLFQAEIDIRQNRIMKILTLVTTIFLPLSLLAGWYGMNFTGMPELTWRYGYPTVIGVSLLIIAASLWICKRKKFW